MGTSTAYADEVKRVRDVGVDTVDIAQATGTATATVTAWARATRQPSGEHRDRLLELVALVERLSRVMDPPYVPVWLHKPLSALDDRRPLEALSKGQYRQVSRLVAELENESFS